VLAYDKYNDFYVPPYGYLRSATQEEIQQKADVISLHVPLTDETHYMIDDKFIKKCKKGVIFLNASRGKVVNFVDLLTHLENGFIGGAALDVFENEKPATYTKEEQHLFERFFGLPNVMVSPHIAGWTNESKERISKIILARILKVFPDPEALVC
jgi:D-3-phosphoglycerate dehydrogenase